MLGASLIAQLVKDLPAMRETLVRFLRLQDPLQKGERYHLASRTSARGRKPSDRTVCVLGCVRMPAHMKQSGGIDLLPWDDHRAGGSNSAFPPLQVNYQPNGGAGTAGREWAEKNPVKPVGFPSLPCLLKLPGFPAFSHFQT